MVSIHQSVTQPIECIGREVDETAAALDLIQDAGVRIGGIRGG